MTNPFALVFSAYMDSFVVMFQLYYSDTPNVVTTVLDPPKMHYFSFGGFGQHTFQPIFENISDTKPKQLTIFNPPD